MGEIQQQKEAALMMVPTATMMAQVVQFLSGPLEFHYYRPRRQAARLIHPHSGRITSWKVMLHA